MLLPLLLSLSFPARAAETSDPLAAAWGGQAVPASWTFVLETAGSYLPAAEAARADIARLIEAAPAGDQVEIIALHTRITEVLPRTTVDDAGRAALVQKIRSLSLPSAKSTDLGAGLAELNARLDKTDPASARFVVMMSGFCHSPSVASAYAAGGAGCRAIVGFEALDKAFDGGRGRQTIDVTLFPVATATARVHPGGLAAVEKFFSPLAGVHTETGTLSEWVTARLPRLAAERFRPLAREEAGRLALTATVTRHATLEDPTAVVSLGTGLPHLALEQATVRVEGGTSGDKAAETQLRLAPSADITVNVAVPPPPFAFFPAHDTVDLPITLTVDGTLAPTEALREAGVDPTRTGLTTSVVIQAERHYGLSAGQAILRVGGAAGAGFLGAVLAAWRLRPLRLAGTFSWRKAGGPRQTLVFPEVAEVAVVVRPDGSLGIGRPDEAVLVLRMERSFGRPIAIAEIRAAEVEINRHPVRPGNHRIVPGATSFQFQDYRLSWE